jgi:SAM-dependent methyltransferase
MHAWFDALLREEPERREDSNLVYRAHGSENWLALQDGAESRYQSHEYNVAELPILHLFGGFIAVGLDSDAIVLDIGCGLTPTPPAYVEQLGVSHYAGLEPLAVTPPRAYPCLVGAMAEQIPLKDDSVDVAIFATSLDHIEDEDKAIAETLRILKPGGRIIFWQGLYEPRVQAAAKTFEPIFHGRWWRPFAAPAEYAHFALRMRKLRHKLANGIPLDNVHARYYTRERFDASLARWQLRKTREILVPGSASLFAEAVPA